MLIVVSCNIKDTLLSPFLSLSLSLFPGACWVNCHNMFDAAAGFGGYRESGFGRDGGKEASICVYL